MPVNTEVMWAMPEWDVAVTITSKTPLAWIVCKGDPRIAQLGHFSPHELESWGLWWISLGSAIASIGLHMS